MIRAALPCGPLAQGHRVTVETIRLATDAQRRLLVVPDGSFVPREDAEERRQS